MLKRLDPKIRPQFFRVHLELDPSRKDFKGVVEIDVRFEKAASVFELHAQGLNFEEVVLVDGDKRIAAIAMGDDAKGLSWFDFGVPLGPGEVTLSFSYHANFASGLEGAYKSKTDKRWAIFTQFEAIGARRVMPCFDEPGFKAPFAVTIAAPNWAKVIANTKAEETTTSGKYSVHRFAPTLPLPSYLIAFAVGDFDVVEHAPIAMGTVSRPAIPLRGISQKGRGDELAYVLSISERLVLEIENYFGIAYPFDKLDIIAVPDFAAGGMENAGAITYDEGYVLLDDDETDLDRKRDMLTLHAHELVHQWFGNLVSPQWWDDLWLNESFATLLESKFSNLVEPRWHFSTDVLLYSHGAMALDLLPSVRRVHEPVVDEDGISTAFDSITYEKGSVVLAMVENVLGEEGFRSFISGLLRERRLGTYDTAGFVEGLRKVPKGGEAADLLLSLIDHTGLPLVDDVTRVFPNDAVPRYQRAKLTEAQWLQPCKKAAGLPLPQALAIAIGFDISFYAREISLQGYFSGVRDLARHAMWEVAGLALENLQFIILELPDIERVRKFAAEVFGPMFVAATPTIDMVVEWQMEKQEADLAEFFAITRADETIYRQLMADGLKLLKEDDPFESSYPQARLVPALLAAAQSNDNSVFQRLLVLLDETDDVHHRSHLIEAICASPGVGIDAVLEGLLQGEALRTHELPELMDSRARFPAFRTELWAMISRNAKDLLIRLEGDSEVALIQVADAFADLKFVSELQSTIAPLMGHLRGGVPQLALTQDKIRLNAALLSHLRQEATP
jgi:hypothetical protein